MRREFKWTNFQFDKLNKILVILNELKKYIPLTLRQIYYQLVGKGFIENKYTEYIMLSNLLKWARIDGYISWDCIEDRVRKYHNLCGWNNSSVFKKRETEIFLEGYSRDLLQTQNKYIELWIEKDALSSIFVKTAKFYTIPVVVCRGFSSVSFLNDFKNRIMAKKDKKPVMLYFGDFDPSGVEMLKSMQTTLTEELGIEDINFKRVALLKEDIDKYKLPHSPDALKKTDTRAKKHLIDYGDLAVELDALRPDILEQKIIDAIEGELDAKAFYKEVEINDKELEELQIVKNLVEKTLNQSRE